MPEIVVHFRGYELEPSVDLKYPVGYKAGWPHMRVLELTDYSEGYPERFCTASVNLPEWFRRVTQHFPEHDPERIVFIKDWSENEGIYDALVEAGVIEEMFFRVPTGWVEAKVCLLTDLAMETLS